MDDCHTPTKNSRPGTHTSFTVVAPPFYASELLREIRDQCELISNHAIIFLWINLHN